MNKEEIIHRMQTYKKINYWDFECRSFGPQSYLKSMSQVNARLRFKIWAKMTPTVRMNFRNNRDYKKSGWACQAPDTQEHILICSAYALMRENKNLEDDSDLVDYFNLVISHRLKQELTAA